MIFSSNQILEVSGNLTHSGEIEMALEFALKYSGEYKNMQKDEIERGCKLVYQITEDGKYCIGWAYKEVPRGWQEYPFKFTVKKVGKIIREHLKKFKVDEVDWDGSNAPGFLMKCIHDNMASEYKNIIKPFYCIVYFEPFNCFYAK